MGAKPTILCVDDEAIVLRSLGEQLRRQLTGYDVEVAEDASEALDLIDELRAEGISIPVVVSDHIMPGIKGDELLARVHALLPETRTILLTGQAGLDAVARAVNEGGLYRYIAKPWAPDDLTLTVREAVRGYFAEQQVREQQVRLAAAHKAATRFVPYAFLSLLGRAELAEVQRGDFVARPVTVYYSDIRSYTTLVEGRTPAENLAWINEYLEAMDRAIHHHGGFVERIAGDSIVALFGTPLSGTPLSGTPLSGTGADAAVSAGIESLTALAELNARRATRGDPPLRIGLGMTTGECIMGILGGDDRLQCSVVGDPVNLAARIESLTKQLGTLLISGETRSALQDPARYAMRLVDHVRVRGLSAPIRLYEVLEGLPADERARKIRSAERLGDAIARLSRGDLDGAAAELRVLAREDPADPALQLHLARAEEFARSGLPADWDGVTRLRSK